MQEHLTKDEKKVLRQQEFQQKMEEEKKKSFRTKLLWWLGGIAVVGFAIWFLVAVVTSPSSSSTPSTVSVPKVTSSDFSIGPKDAKVTLIEYADFQCPACRAYYPLVKQLLQDEQGKILYVYRFFPLAQPHKNAIHSLEAALAGAKQNKFWEMQDTLFTKQDEWAELSDPENTFVSYAKTLGLNTDQFKKDYESKEISDFASKQEDIASGYGLTYTPSFILNGKLITNPNTYQDFKKLVDQQLTASK